MKKNIIAFALLALSGSAAAQIAAYSQSKSQAVVDSYTLPRTVIRVAVTQEREVILRGPYARYASQYLGVIGAPQTDKENFKILGAAVSFIEEPDPVHTYVIDEKTAIPTKVFRWLDAVPPVLEVTTKDADYAGATIGNQNPFTDMGTTIVNSVNDALSADRTSSVAKSPEQMAADAAATIFKLRKKRIELICAEQGENVFGAGLKAALKEIDKLESEYLALFIGKRFTQTTVSTYDILPEVGKNTSVACRFSVAKGVVSESDLSASPLTLEITPAKGQSTPSMDTRKPGGRTLPVRIPQIMQVKLSLGDQVLDSERVPVYQFGSVIQAPVV